jgi:AraC family transcriptional regulator of adaptative response / DNA-3-methyladenine glycosylase II
MAFIADGGLSDERSLRDLADHTGVGLRQLRRLFGEHVGASPVQVVSAHRVAFATALLVDSTLSVTEVAFAAGFRSLRRFNDVFKAMFGRPPSSFRRGITDLEARSSAIRVRVPAVHRGR